MTHDATTRWSHQLGTRFSRGLLLVLALSVAACSGDEGGSGNADDDGGGAGTPTPTLDCGPGESDERCAVFQLVNQERSQAGVAPYTWNAELALAAQLHAEDMVANGYFDHTSLDGRNFSDRAEDAGYDAFATGENIAQGQQNAESVMQSWMNSPGHASNILSPNSNEIGVGLQDLHWVQVFGNR